MLIRGAVCAMVVAALLGLAAPVQAFDNAMYPDLSGQWIRIRDRVGAQITFDPTKPWGLGQQAPLTPEYQKILEASLADQANGGQGEDPGYRCSSHAMPRVMLALLAIQFAVLPETTYVMLE